VDAEGGRSLGSWRSSLAAQRKRMGPLIRNLRSVTDPLFRHAGIDLDRE
jgi:hypothetical protein